MPQTRHTQKPLTFQEVFVMGMPHTGLTALARELSRKYPIPIYPKSGKLFHPNGAWKFSNQVSPFQRDPRVLVIVLIKDPFFWVQSLKRNPGHLRNQRLSTGENKTTIDFLQDLNFNGRSYQNIADLWNQSLANYLNPTKFPPTNTMVITTSEFLYQFRDIQERLDEILLAPDAPKGYLPPCYLKSQPHSKTCRDRFSAEDYYHPENRYQNLTNQEIKFLKQQLQAPLLQRLHFKTDDFIGQALTSQNLKTFTEQQRQQYREKQIPTPTTKQVLETISENSGEISDELQSSLLINPDQDQVQDRTKVQNPNQPLISEKLDEIPQSSQSDPPPSDQTLECVTATVKPYLIPPKPPNLNSLASKNPILLEHLLLHLPNRR